VLVSGKITLHSSPHFREILFFAALRKSSTQILKTIFIYDEIPD
jgi:hypothetical protein